MPRCRPRRHTVAAVLFFTIALAAGATVAQAGTVSIAWDPNSDPDLAGYRVYWGQTPGTYDQSVDVGLVTQYTLDGLTDCQTWYVAVKAVDDAGQESVEYSNEVSGWPRPTVVSATPASGEQGARMDVVVGGTNFMDGALPSFGNAGITVLGTTRNACGELVADIQIAATAPLGTSNVDVDNPDGVFGSGLGLFTVVEAVEPPTVTSHPQDQTVTEGETATFSVAATGTEPLSYQWQRNGVDIAGATSSSYTTPTTTLSDDGAVFRCVVTNEAGSDTSNGATLTVTDGTAPTVTGANPPNGAVDVDPAIRPTVTFSEAMDPASVTTGTVRLLDAGGVPVAQSGNPTLSADGRTATITPASALQEDATYRIQVIGGSAGVLDTAGNPMATTWQQPDGFTVRPPADNPPETVLGVRRSDTRSSP